MSKILITAALLVTISTSAWAQVDFPRPLTGNTQQAMEQLRQQQQDERDKVQHRIDTQKRRLEEIDRQQERDRVDRLEQEVELLRRQHDR